MKQTKVLKIDPIHPDKSLISEAARTIISGGLVAFPTETVYGLGADVFNEEAVKKIFIAKKRPADNPLIVHIADLDILQEIAKDIPEKAYRLIDKAWPGPLTIILKKSPRVPKIVTGGLDTIAVRLPGHPVAIELIKTANTPIAAPSANLSGRPSPINAEHVKRDLWGRIDIIIDSGDTFFGVESTVLNILSTPPTILRPGPISVEDIETILGEKVSIPDSAKGYTHEVVPLSPGMKYRHYSPVVPIILIESDNKIKMIEKIVNLSKEEEKRNKKVIVITTREDSIIYEEQGIKTIIIGSRHNLYEIAKNLYKVLHEIEELDIDLAISESFEERGIGLAIMNRLRKASIMILKT